VSDSEPAHVTGADLKRAVLHLAVAACSCPAMPDKARAMKARSCSAVCSRARDGPKTTSRPVTSGCVGVQKMVDGFLGLSFSAVLIVSGIAIYGIGWLYGFGWPKD
jgi:hypothetical protein